MKDVLMGIVNLIIYILLDHKRIEILEDAYKLLKEIRALK